MRRRRQGLSTTAQHAAPPTDLRSTELWVDGQRFVVLSYVSAPEAPLRDLSRAESAVARAAGRGVTAIEIAKHRGLSVSTIHNQLASAYRKLGVSSRAELSALLAEIEPDEA